MELFYKEYRVKQESLRLFLVLDYNPIIYKKIRVNRMLYDCNHHGDWDYFVEKQKKRGEIYIVLIYPKSILIILWEVEKFQDSFSNESSGSSTGL